MNGAHARGCSSPNSAYTSVFQGTCSCPTTSSICEPGNMLPAVTQRACGTKIPPMSRPWSMRGAGLWTMCFRSPYRTFRHLAIQQSFITRTISLHRPASEPSTRYRRPFHTSTTACAADSDRVPSGGSAVKDEKGTSQNNERVNIDAENPPWDNSIHIVGQKETPKNRGDLAGGRSSTTFQHS